jgi:hypothetical protein
METQIINATEYRNVFLALLSESNTNPRRTFEEITLKELAGSILVSRKTWQTPTLGSPRQLRQQTKSLNGSVRSDRSVSRDNRAIAILASGDASMESSRVRCSRDRSLDLAKSASISKSA